MSDLEPLPANVRLLIPSSIAPPRLQGTSALEVQALAESNKAAIEPLLDHYLKNPTPLLVINDLTIYLHAGSVQRLVKIIQPAKTFIGNAYHGEFLRDDRGSHISAREREAVDELLPLMDYVIRLPGMQR